MPEARLEDNRSGLAPAGDGWFVVNVRDAQWAPGATLVLGSPSLGVAVHGSSVQ